MSVLVVVALVVGVVVGFFVLVWGESWVVGAAMRIAEAKGLDPVRYREDRGTWWLVSRWVGLVEVVVRHPAGLGGVRLRDLR